MNRGEPDRAPPIHALPVHALPIRALPIVRFPPANDYAGTVHAELNIAAATQPNPLSRFQRPPANGISQCFS